MMSPMHRFVIFTFLLVSVCARYTNNNSFHRRRSYTVSVASSCSQIPSLMNRVQGEIDERPVTGLSVVNEISRGGSLAVNDGESEEVFILQKLRNTIRSILEVGDRKAPAVSKIFKVWIRILEKVSGVDLLPSVKVKDSKRSNKKEKKREKKQVEDTSSSSKKKKRQKKNDSSNGSAVTQQHLAKDLKATNPNYRIQRELKEFMRSPPPNLTVKVGKNIRIWIVTLTGAPKSLYEGEKYRLRIQFPPDYPTVPPSVYFLQPTPKHEHVYSNGDICLSLLGKDWRPTMTAQSIANSILSILNGAQRKSIPMDNAKHAQNKPGESQENWVYHDDNC